MKFSYRQACLYVHIFTLSIKGSCWKEHKVAINNTNNKTYVRYWEKCFTVFSGNYKQSWKYKIVTSACYQPALLGVLTDVLHQTNTLDVTSFLPDNLSELQKCYI